MTKQSRAIGVYRHGDVESLVNGTVEVPAPGPNEVLIRTTALGVNPADVYFRSTPWEDIAQSLPKQIPPPGSLRVVGADFAGVIESAGTGVESWSVGDEVFGSASAMAATGASSEYIVVDSRILAPLPQALSPERAVAWPMVGITAWESLFDVLRIRTDGTDSDASLLVIGGTGGTGSAAIQLGKAVAAMTVTATAGSESGRSWCERLGADAVVNHHQPLLDQLPDGAFDFIVCCASAAKYLDTMARLIAPFGHICAVMADLDPVPFDGLRLRSASFGMEFMGLRSMGPQIERHGRILTEISRLIDDGRLADLSAQRLSPIDADTLRRGHVLVEQGGHGKVTVSHWPERQ
ncbi:MAG: zinc-binding dehydrogenase [Mycobacterium sp.]|nr:zinc-binding dehydrogenase [Mycobacterium sp.]